MSKTKKISKRFRDNKQLQKYVKDIDFGFVDIIVQHKEKIQDLGWSEIYNDDVIGCSQYSASTGNSNRRGSVALNKKLVEKTSWRLSSHGASLGFSMGIAVIPKDQCQGWMYHFNQHKSGLGQGYYLLDGGQAYSDYYEEDNKISNFQMENQDWIILTYDPAANILNFFNETTGKSYKLKIKPQQEDVSYYPVVVLYKATMYQYSDDDLPDDYYDQLYEEHLERQREEEEYNNQLIEDHFQLQRQQEDQQIDRLHEEHLELLRQKQEQEDAENERNNQLYEEHLQHQIQQTKQKDSSYIQSENKIITGQINSESKIVPSLLAGCKKDVS